MSTQSLRVTALAVILFTGCSSVYTVYPSGGGQQNAATVSPKAAVLVNAGDSHIWIVSVDGERKGVPSHGKYAFLPGRHTVRVQYFWTRDNMTWTGNDLADYAFDVKEGAKLQVMCQHTEEPGHSYNVDYKGTWKFWIEDASSGDLAVTEASGPIVVREATGELIEPPFVPQLFN